MPPTDDEFGELVRALRLAAGLAQEQLALAAGLSVRTLRNLERGRTKGPQRHTVDALARALDLTAEEARGLEAMAASGRPRGRRMARVAPAAALSLPRDLTDFTARDRAFAELEDLADAQASVVVVAGAPGLGKTAFAVRAAHRLASRFPEGRFHLDLRGMDSEPVGPGAALDRLLRALGVTGRAIPRDEHDRAGLFRSHAANRRLLLILDNAADEAQVRPLLPGSGPSLALVTSRNSLLGLEGVHRVELPLLRREEAVRLLTRIVGPERVAREAQTARDLADLCGRLPLALRIAGQRLAARPRESIARLAAQLEREERRLDALQAGDLKVRSAFALSYERLDPVSRRVLRRCSLAAGPDVSPETAALLADVPVGEVRLRLEELCDRGLLQTDPRSERYRFHDLLGLFAAERTAADDDRASREAALDRTARWMLARATAAALRFDAERHDAPTGDPDPATAPADRDRARVWLEAERAQWLAALRHAHTAGLHRLVVDTAEAMHWFSDTTHHWEQWVEVFDLAAAAARALGSRPEEAAQLNYLAWAHSLCAYDNHAAFAAALRALDVAQACGDRVQTGWALGYGGGALRRLGRTREAVSWLRDAESCHRDNASPEGRLAWLSSVNALGEAYREQGAVESAIACHLSSVAASRKGLPGVAPDVVAAYRGLSLLYLARDYMAGERWYEAEPRLRQAHTLFAAGGMPAWSGQAQLELGRVLRGLGLPRDARAAFVGALDTLRGHNSPHWSEAIAELRTIAAGRTVPADGRPAGLAPE
ncbi:ATP-binding protein [Streptomyces hydrogenans]